MYCRNCGFEMDNNATVCVQCGCARGTGLSYCPSCGKRTEPNAVVCVSCGVALGRAVEKPNGKSRVLAGLMGIFFGCFGVHNFILGYTGKAVAQFLMTILSCFLLAPVSTIWGLIEGILILAGSINQDAKGTPLAD